MIKLECSKTDCRYKNTIVCTGCDGSTYYIKATEYTTKKEKTPRIRKTKERKIARRVPFDGITWGTFYE